MGNEKSIVGKALIAQGGGPTAVINQSLVGAVLEARRFGQIESVYGALHGVSGIVNENFVNLTEETTANLELVAGSPAAALGSTRDKPDLKYCQESALINRTIHNKTHKKTNYQNLTV